MEAVAARTADKHNYGLDLLRLYAGYTVVSMHFGGQFLEGLWAVPVFAMLAFYLASAGIRSGDKSRQRKRLLRLLLPQLVWTAVYWIGFRAIWAITGDAAYQVGLRALLVQLVFGGSEQLNRPMWYLVDILALTAVWMVLAGFADNRRKLTALAVILTILALAFEYTGLNVWAFGRFADEYKWTLGRLVELMPFACLGICLAEYRALDRIKEHAKISIPILLAVYVLLLLTENCAFFAMPQGFCYSGIFLFLRTPVVIGIFYALPLDGLQGRFADLMRTLGRLTFGVYCIHYGVGQILLNTYGWPEGAGLILRTALIYAISLLAARLILLIPIDLIRKCVV